MAGNSGARNNEAILLVGFCIWYTLEDSGKWVGQKKGGDEFHCNKLSNCDCKKATYGYLLTLIH